MDRSKWILAMGIVAVMLAVSASLFVYDTQADDVISLDLNTSAYDEDKKSYSIGNLQGLKNFASLVNDGKTFNNMTVSLTADITITYESETGEWTPIGDGSRNSKAHSGDAFGGTFDGKGHWISGLRITSVNTGEKAVGLFGIVNGGTIKNLTLLDVKINAVQNELTGAVAGMLYNGGKIQDCTVGAAGTSDKSSITAYKGVGGFVGRIVQYGVVENCKNYASVAISNYTGSDSTNLKLGYNCGGIVGAAYYTDNDHVMSIRNCANYGAISVPSNIKGIGGIGGIVGLSAANVTNCVNNGTVTGSGSSVGGIVGEQKAYGSVTGCTNTKTITNNGEGGTYGTGGIVGWARYFTNGENSAYPMCGMIQVVGCVNYGNVLASGANNSGGIIGMVYNWAYVSGNINMAGKIQAVTFASGIMTYQYVGDNAYDFKEEIKKELTFSWNVSTTADLQANCTDPLIYTNGNPVSQFGNTRVLPAGFSPQTGDVASSSDQSSAMIIPKVSITTDGTPLVAGKTVRLTATVSNMLDGSRYGYLWSDGSTGAYVDVSSQGTWTVEVTVSDGVRTFSGSSEMEIIFTDNVTKETDESGTTVTVIEKTDGSKVTVTETADKTSVTTVTEKTDGSKVTVIEDSTKNSVTTVTEEQDGSKITEIVDSSNNSVTTKIENPDKTEITTKVEDSKGTSLTTEIKTVSDTTIPTTISTTTVVVKDKSGQVTSAEAKAEVEVQVEETTEASSVAIVSTDVVQAALDTIVVEESEVESKVTKTFSVIAATTQISLDVEATRVVSDSSASLEFKGTEGTLTADADVVKNIAKQDESLTLSFTKATEDDLQEPQKEIVKDSTAYQLKLTKSDGTEVHELKGTVNVSVQYELPSNVAASEVVVIYVDDYGNMTAMDTKYESGTLSFTTDHFSCYMIGTKSMLEPTEPDVKPPIFIVIPDSGDDSVPIVIVDQNTTSESDDGSVKTIACVAAAVVVVIMLLFLARDIRTK